MTRYPALFAAAALAGCSGSAIATSSPIAPSQPTLSQSRLLQSISPATCDKKVRVTINTHGGSFNLPPCSGWTGMIGYPTKTGDRLMFAVTSSVMNNFGAPPPQSGVAIFYLQTKNTTRRAGGPVFGGNGVTDTVTSPALTSDHTYTLIVYNFMLDSQCSTEPCGPWVESLGSPAPGSNSLTFVSPLNGAAFSNTPPVWQFVQD